jgi:hypothetical protein
VPGQEVGEEAVDALGLLAAEAFARGDRDVHLSPFSGRSVRDQRSRRRPATRAGSAWSEVLRWWRPSKTTSRKSGKMAASRFPERS